MNRRRRDQLIKARRKRDRAHLAGLRQRYPVPSHGTGVPGDRCWVLRNPYGEPKRLAVARAAGKLAWAIDPGWTVGEVAGVVFDRLRARGVPVVDGVTLQPLRNLRPPPDESREPDE